MDTFEKSPIPPHIRQHFAAQTASGKTIKEYSTEAGISPLTFYTWRKKYLNKKTSAPRFSSFGALSLQQLRQPLFDLHLYGGTRVSIYAGTTAEELAPFIRMLSGDTRPC
jgi:Transposase